LTRPFHRKRRHFFNTKVLSESQVREQLTPSGVGPTTQKRLSEQLAYMVAQPGGSFVDISCRYQPDRALSTLSYGLKHNFNLSQSHHGHIPIACAHTTGNSNTHLSQVSYRNLLRSQYKQGCNQCEQSYTQVYHHLYAHQLHLNAPYKHISVIVSTSPVGSTT
jgi:hypothetical protein